MTAWVARAGRYGEREQYALDRNMVVAGWEEVGDLSAAETRDAVRSALAASTPGMSDAKLAIHTGQLWAFSHRMQTGDLVVLPCKTTGTLAIGRISGRYEYQPDNPPDARHTRPVDWDRTDIARSGIGRDLNQSLNSALTIFSVERHHAAERLTELAATGNDPGAAKFVGLVPEDDLTGAEPSDTSAPVDLEDIAAERIKARIAERFTGHRLEELVGAILEAEGYTVRVSPPGTDGGIDVLAGSGPLGLESPRIAVQVKSTGSPESVMTVRDLQGAATTVGADSALLVAWQGLTGDAVKHLRNLWFTVRVWTAEDVITRTTENYDRLPAEIQADLPLKQVWTLALDDD